jgi:Zn-dependent peptidase ImmA (M78 family)/transcriptional regulator with XRE-family HTH domain
VAPEDSTTTSSIDPVAVGVRLAEARRARGMTQQQAAAALGVARTTVTAMEKGERRPRGAELLRLAQLYGRKVGDLTRPLSPVRPLGFAVQFRAARGASADDPNVSADIAEFQSLAEDYAELEHLAGTPLPRRYPELYDVSGTDPGQAAEEVATSERARLGLGDGPILDVWAVLESDVGLRIFAPPFLSKTAGMFLHTSEYGSCIAVNGRHPEERRRWTVAHEYAHFLVDRHRPEITILPVYRRVPESERFADAFAAAFLMPASGLIRHFQAIKRAKDGPITPADVLALCHRYRVSFQAMILRLEELRLLPPATWDRLRERGFKADKARALIDLPRIEPALRQLPLRFEVLAVQAFEQEKLSEGQLARMLRTDRVGARQRVQQLTEAAPDFEAGAWHQVSLDLSATLAGQPS